jgi:hypothetical protein
MQTDDKSQFKILAKYRFGCFGENLILPGQKYHTDNFLELEKLTHGYNGYFFEINE